MLHPPPSKTMVVDRKDRVAEGVVQLTLRPVGGRPVPEWAPGAHIDLILGGDDTVRQYSLCGDPADRAALRVAVLREEKGRGGSRFVHDLLSVGDEVPVAGPRNHFPLVGDGDLLFIAGGIGITPILPMLPAASAQGREWALLYGGRNREAMAFVDELTTCHGSRVTVWPEDECGLLPIDETITDAHSGTLVYCCGPEALLLAVEAACGAAPGLTLHTERFSPREVPPSPEAVDEFTVVCARADTQVRVSSSQSIVDALAAAGIEVDTSCRAGTCGTCETGVLEGIPDHRDSLLTADERAANDVMFICVSRSNSETLVLDL